jgi:hypothetical protein
VFCDGASNTAGELVTIVVTAVVVTINAVVVVVLVLHCPCFFPGLTEQNRRSVAPD